MYLYILKHGNAAAVSYYGSSGWCSLLLLFIDFRFGPVQFPFLMRIYINLFSFPIFFYFFFALFVCIDTLCVMCTHAAMDCHPRLTLCLPVRFIFSWLLLLLFIASREMRQKKKKKKKKEIPSDYCGRRTFSNWFGGITRWNSSAAAPAWRNHSISLQFFTWLDARPQHPHQQMIDTHADRRSK